MICKRCNGEFDHAEPKAKEYSVCNNCWDEWKKYSIMVINDLRLDMSIKEHRALLKKYERVYFGLEKAEDVRDLSKEEERVPDKS
ncbi:MAG: Fe(2+)-trafficking protein [Candidatus Nitrosocaldaceae archaeon]